MKSIDKLTTNKYIQVIPLDVVRHINEKNNGDWFSDANTKFMNSKYEDSAFSIEGLAFVFFVTSEKQPFADSRRLWTLRKMNIFGGKIETVGEFNKIPTKEAAYEFLLNTLLDYRLNV